MGSLLSVPNPRSTPLRCGFSSAIRANFQTSVRFNNIAKILPDNSSKLPTSMNTNLGMNEEKINLSFMIK